MHINKKLTVTISLVSIVGVAAPPTFHRTRPAVRCDIPTRNYQHTKLSQPLRSLSNIAVFVDTQATSTPDGIGGSRLALGNSDRRQPRVKSFQFVKDPVLQIDHCSVSEMSVLLHENGEWSISLRANQNPVNAAKVLDVTTLEPKQLFTDHLQRNKFHVTVNCYVQYGTAVRDSLLGKPLVIPLAVNPFWVQRQQPYTHFEPGYSPEIQRHFDSIDRVEIEFAYQLD